MVLIGLSIYEQIRQSGVAYITEVGELLQVTSSGFATGTSYFTPAAPDWVSGREWGDKTFLVNSDQPVAVDLLNSEDSASTFQTVTGKTIAATVFIPNTWNIIDVSHGLGLVKLRFTSQGTAPTKVSVIFRFMKQG